MDWARTKLPQSWVDQGSGFAPSYVAKMLLKAALPRKPVKLPEGVPMAEQLPDYLLQEFHSIPNGNYSHLLAAGYATCFDYAMLGRLKKPRADAAARFAGCQAVLDVGSGSGSLAAAIKAVGVPRVVGLDPSPYMLQYAARKVPDVEFVQGLVEKMEFADESFDGAGACFLFHELPTQIQDDALVQLHRVLKPGALLTICEPAPDQLQGEWKKLLELEGLKAGWWKLLIQLVHEPYVKEWHAREPRSWLASGGFELIEDSTFLPVRSLVARRV